MKTSALALLSLTATLLANPKTGPTLEVLPINSTLKNVTIPRFDDERNRVAFLKADLMEILADGGKIDGRQPIMVDCSGIQLRMKNKDLMGDVRVDMKRARYRLRPGVLTVEEELVANSDAFRIRGQGGVFHLDTRRGFIFGPLECDVFEKPKTETVNTRLSFPPLAAALVMALPLTLSAQLPEHRPPSKMELLRTDQLSLPEESTVKNEQNRLSEALQNQNDAVAEADRLLAQFSAQVESKSLNLLVQNPPKPAPAVDEPPAIKDPTLSITCDGGGFFDGNANLLVFLRNVIVTEKRFTLKANKELKVFFADAVPKEGKAKADKEEMPEVNIGEVKTLVATGGINFSGIDKDGNPFEASAATASYDNQKNQLILKDGTPTFQATTPRGVLRFKAESTDASVRIDLTEDSFSAHTSPNGWQFDLGN